MRDTEKIKNTAEDKTKVYKPVIIVTVILVIIIGLYIWLGIKYPVVFGNIRDLTITLIAVLFFIISAAIAVLCFYLSARIENAKLKIDEAVSTADGKVEETGEQISDILKKILEPVIESETHKAGILRVLSALKKKEAK